LTIRLIKRVLIFLVTTSMLASCDWDPAHDSIFDPDNPLYRPVGSLRLTVLTLIQQPIYDAVVQLPDVGRFGTTDTNGVAYFDDLPEGDWWVVAYRNSVPDTVYAADSVKVSIKLGVLTEASLRLDAVPSFISVTVNSITQYVDPDTNYIYARLTARVFDPDGDADLDRVEWWLQDNGISMQDTLDFAPDPDSALWWAEIPSEDFPDSNLSNTLTRPFTFEAFDRAENSSQSTAILARIIYSSPELQPVGAGNPPTLEWYFRWTDEHLDLEYFYYILNIYSTQSDESLVYRKQISPTVSIRMVHIVEEELETGGTYWWDVWVFDRFGNSVRSPRPGFVVR